MLLNSTPDFVKTSGDASSPIPIVPPAVAPIFEILTVYVSISKCATSVTSFAGILNVYEASLDFSLPFSVHLTK